MCPLLAGLGAGLLAGLVDAGWAATRGLGATGLVALVTLDLFAGLLLGGTFAALLSGAVLLRRRWRVPLVVTVAVVCCLTVIPLGIELFSGSGVRRTVLGQVGPVALPLMVALLAWALWAAMARMVARPSPWARIVAGLFCLVLCAGALVADRMILVGLYPYLHVVAAWSALALVGLAVGLTFCAGSTGRGHGRLASLGTAVTVLAAVLVFVWFPSTNEQRLFISEQPALAGRVVQALTWVVDLDRDGSSPILGGGDCDDFDGQVGPFRAEIEANGRDEDCDGKDFVPHGEIDLAYPHDEQLAADVRARAGRFPTVILMVDALRADRVGRPAFVNLTRLARRSLWFRHAYAPASSTSLSIPAIAVGRPLPEPTDASVFEKLRRRGIRTGLVTVDAALDAITGKILTHGNLAYPFEKGFDEVRRVETRYDPLAWGGGIKTYTGSRVTRSALQLVDAPNPPRVLWVHYFDLHQWQHLRPLRQSGVARYDETLALLDEELGHWLQRAHQLNLILLADHGELLGEHGKRSHTNWLYRELVHVPLLLSVPGVAPASIARPVALTDLAATLLDMHGRLGAADPSGRRSLLGVVGTASLATRPIAMFEVRQVSLLSGRWRYLGDKKTHAQWLFDLQKDPLERSNLAEAHPHRTAAMRAQLMALYARFSGAH